MDNNNLENSIKDCIAKELEKGVIEKVISEKLESCISDAIKDMFGWNGKIKEIIEGKIKSVMIPYLENYDYSKYITKLDSVLIDVLKESSIENKKLLENFKELMSSEDVPKKINITDIYQKWCDYCKENIDKDKIDNYDDYEGGCINVSLDVEEVSSDWSDYKKLMVKFECEEDEDFNVEFMVSKWTSFRDDYTLDWNTPSDLKSLRNLSRFDVYMMRLSQVRCKVDIDKEFANDEIYIEGGE